MARDPDQSYLPNLIINHVCPLLPIPFAPKRRKKFFDFWGQHGIQHDNGHWGQNWVLILSWTLSSSGNNSKWLTTLSPSFPLHWVQTLASQPPDPGCCWEMGSLLPMLSVSRGCCGDLGRQRTGGFFVTWHRYMHRCCRVLVICKWRTRSADYPCLPPCSAPPPISDGRAGPGWVSGSLLTAHPFAPSPFPTEIQLYLLSQQPSA